MTDRHYIERDPSGGRRLEDKQKCPNCDILWKHHDEDRRDHREAICREIKKVAGEVEKVDQKIAAQGRAHSAFVPRWRKIFTRKKWKQLQEEYQMLIESAEGK